MGLTLNSLSLSSGSGSGLTEEDVKDLIEYEYITRVPVTSAATISITDSIDSTLYDGFKFVILNIGTSTSTSLYFRVLNSAVTAYTTNGLLTIKQSTGRTYDNTSSPTNTNILVTASIGGTLVGGTHGEIQVDCTNDTVISGKYSFNWDQSPNGFSHGSFKTTSAPTFGGISLYTSSGNFISKGEVRVYGRKKRS